MEETILLEVNKKDFEKLKRILEVQEDGLYREYLDLYFKEDKLIIQCDINNIEDYTHPSFESIGNLTLKEKQIK